MKIVTITGIRPDFIKMSEAIIHDWSISYRADLEFR